MYLAGLWMVCSTDMKWLRYLAGFLIITGMLSFFGAAVCTGVRYRIPMTWNMPLGDVGSIAVDHAGNIYLSSQGYMRIHAFGPDGQFLRSWASPEKDPVLSVDARNRLHAKSGEDIVFDQQGRVIARHQLPEEPVLYTGKWTLRCRSDSGDLYTVMTPNLWPRVIKTDPWGTSRLLMTTPFHLWMVAGPLPGWLRAVLGMLILKIMDRKRSASPPAHEDQGM